MLGEATVLHGRYLGLKCTERIGESFEAFILEKYYSPCFGNFEIYFPLSPKKNAHVVRDKNCNLNFFILYLRQTQTMVAKTSYFPPQVAVNTVSFYVEKI